MQINLTNDKARIKLTKHEVKALDSARQILEGLEKFEPSIEHVAELVRDVTDQIDADGFFVRSDSQDKFTP